MFAASELFKCTSATSRGLAEAEDGGAVWRGGLGGGGECGGGLGGSCCAYKLTYYVSI